MAIEKSKAECQAVNARKEYMDTVNQKFDEMEMTKEKKQELICMATGADGEDVCEEFSCPICLALVYEPMTCSVCQNHLYCSHCVESLQNYKRKCPMCKNGTMVECNKLVRKMLDSTKVLCNGDNCSLDGKPITYQYFVQQHLDQCQEVKMSCPHHCDCSHIFRSKEEAKAHYDVCPKAIVFCERCDESQERAILDKHDCQALCLEKQQKLLESQKEQISEQQATYNHLAQQIKALQNLKKINDTKLLKQRIVQLDIALKDILSAIKDRQTKKKQEMKSKARIELEQSSLIQINEPVSYYVPPEPKFKLWQLKDVKNEDVKAIMTSLQINSQHAQMLNWRYISGSSDRVHAEKDLENVKNIINFIKEKRQITDANLAYKILVAAKWDPACA